MLGELKNMLCKELGEITHEPLNAGNLDAIYKMVDVVKDITTINAMDEEYPEDHRYSQRYPYYYMDGEDMVHSHARGRTGYVRRDAMGRYSRDEENRKVIDHLEKAMDEARDDKQREDIRRIIDNLQR